MASTQQRAVATVLVLLTSAACGPNAPEPSSAVTSAEGTSEAPPAIASTPAIHPKEATSDATPGTSALPVKRAPVSLAPEGDKSPTQPSAEAQRRRCDGLKEVDFTSLKPALRLPAVSSSWADRLFAAAVKPEAPPQAVVDAIASLERQQVRYQRIRPRLASWRQELLSGTVPKGKRVRSPASIGVDAHTLLVPALDAATIRLRVKGLLSQPLEGGQNFGAQFLAFGLLLGAEVAGALARGDNVEAWSWLQRQARFGVLMSRSARTLDELVAGHRAFQDAVALVSLFQRRTPQLTERISTPDLLTVRQALGQSTGHVTRLGAFFKQGPQPCVLSHIALKEPNPIWRYEALIALSRPIHEAPLSNRAADSRRELQMLSEEGGPGVKALARQMLGEASSVSEP